MAVFASFLPFRVDRVWQQRIIYCPASCGFTQLFIGNSSQSRRWLKLVGCWMERNSIFHFHGNSMMNSPTERKNWAAVWTRDGESEDASLFKRFSPDFTVRQRSRSREMCLMMQEAKKPAQISMERRSFLHPTAQSWIIMNLSSFSAIVFSLANQKI